MENTIEALRQYDPSLVETELGFFRTLRQKWMMMMQICLPSIVIEYDEKKHIAKVMPIVLKTYQTNAGNVSVPRGEYSVPVLYQNHNGISISWKLKKGDTGYLFACDRNPDDAIKENSKPVIEPIEKDEITERHLKPASDGSVCCFENGFFIPFSFAEESSNSQEDNCIVLSTVEKSVSENGLKVTIGKTEKDGRCVNVETDSVSFKISDKNGINVSSDNHENISLISDVRYDVGSHQIQKKKRDFKKTGNLMYDPSAESEWFIVEGGQAYPIENQQ